MRSAHGSPTLTGTAPSTGSGAGAGAGAGTGAGAGDGVGADCGGITISGGGGAGAGAGGAAQETGTSRHITNANPILLSSAFSFTPPLLLCPHGVVSYLILAVFVAVQMRY